MNSIVLLFSIVMNNRIAMVVSHRAMGIPAQCLLRSTKASPPFTWTFTPYSTLHTNIPPAAHTPPQTTSVTPVVFFLFLLIWFFPFSNTYTHSLTSSGFEAVSSLRSFCRLTYTFASAQRFFFQDSRSPGILCLLGKLG